MYQIKEPDTIRDEDAVVRVETEKGAVCMTADRLDKQREWRFGVVGNIVHSHKDENGELRYGTKAFKPGTKVYLGGKYWDDTNPNIGVIGLNRFGRTVEESVPVELVENVRTQRIYNPKVIAIMDHLEVMDGWEWWKRTAADRKDTERFVSVWLKNSAHK